MRRWPLLLLCLALPAAAAEDVRFVSDELAVTLRKAASADSPGMGLLNSGARVEVVEADAAAGYVRVRTADGRDGWLLARYLKNEPIARERMQRLEKQLTQATAELKELREQHEQLKKEHARVTSGLPPAAPEELVRENAALRAASEQANQERTQVIEKYDTARAEQRTLVLGGGLVAGGMLLAWLLRLMWPRRRGGDF